MAHPASFSDREVCFALIEGVRRLAGHQVIGFDKACRVFFRYGADELTPDGVKLLHWLLEELGYEQQWVALLGRQDMRHVWVRGPWPIDFYANLNREFDAFVPMS